MQKSKIDWTEYVWNPVHGCSKVSTGCDRCYAERRAKTMAGRVGYPEVNPFQVTVCLEKLDEPLYGKKGKRIFVCSMGDLFHPEVPDEVIHRIFETMWHCQEHTFYVLTKRPGRMFRLLQKYPPYLEPYNHIWIGVSCENQDAVNFRIPELLEIAWYRHFVSLEPLLERVNIEKFIVPQLNGERIEWVIAGPETGPGARFCEYDWMYDLKVQCKNGNQPLFCKGKQFLDDVFPRQLHK